MPDQQEKTSSDGAKMYDPSNLAKGEIYDLINQIIHAAAAAWQTKIAKDGGIHVVCGGAYAGKRSDPRERKEEATHGA